MIYKEKGLGKEGRVGMGCEGGGGSACIQLRRQLTYDTNSGRSHVPFVCSQHHLLLCTPHRSHADPMPCLPCVMAGRKCPMFCNTVCCSYLASLPCCIDAMSVSHTQCDTIRPRPTCEIRPTGMSLIEREGRPSQAMRWVAPRRREPLCSGP